RAPAQRRGGGDVINAPLRAASAWDAESRLTRLRRLPTVGERPVDGRGEDAMPQLALNDLKLGLKELAENKDKQQLLAPTRAGGLYLPLLAQKRQEIDALPASLVDTGRPLAEQLATEDGAHDGYGLAIWHMSEAYR